MTLNHDAGRFATEGTPKVWTMTWKRTVASRRTTVQSAPVRTLLHGAWLKRSRCGYSCTCVCFARSRQVHSPITHLSSERRKILDLIRPRLMVSRWERKWHLMISAKSQSLGRSATAALQGQCHTNRLNFAHIRRDKPLQSRHIPSYPVLSRQMKNNSDTYNQHTKLLALAELF